MASILIGLMDESYLKLWSLCRFPKSGEVMFQHMVAKKPSYRECVVLGRLVHKS